jgi:hypothetical protein
MVTSIKDVIKWQEKLKQQPKVYYIVGKGIESPSDFYYSKEAAQKEADCRNKNKNSKPYKVTFSNIHNLELSKARWE